MGARAGAEEEPLGRESVRLRAAGSMSGMARERRGQSPGRESVERDVQARSPSLCWTQQREQLAYGLE